MTIDPREAARFIERERYVGSEFVRNARIVARALLAGPSPAVREALEELVKHVEREALHAGKGKPGYDKGCPFCRSLTAALAALAAGIRALHPSAGER